MLSKRVKLLSPSPTLSLGARIKEMKRSGLAVIDLSVGEPDYQTPEPIKQAGIRAIKEGKTGYTAVAGLPELRHAVCERIKKDKGIVFKPEQILIGPGSKLLLYAALQVLCDPGDEVLVTVPTWSTYIEQIRLAGGVPVVVQLSAPFNLKAEDLRKQVTAKTKVVLLNSPANPTGSVVDRKELEKIAELAVEKKLWVISDEIYEEIVYGNKPTSIAALGEEIAERSVIINGWSKAYAMTGWRIGYAAGSNIVIEAMGAIQSQTTSNACSISQWAALEATVGTQEPIQDMLRSYEKRRNFILRSLEQIEGLKITEPKGAFYVFVGIEGLLRERYKTSLEWCEALLKEEEVSVVPGEAFLYPGYFRMSFAAKEEDLIEGIKRIERFVNTTKR